ncbi:LamG domain-containing protein [Polyangium sorediatum]|uniref:LamG domain-containing protein n=1 Tax=Polyangium sorediatum TaxID=889274 RepID=A0ABT6NKM2_9BACT|nr:LamG domain-containing protein [Polyangium sorediatum]MDI1428851.1 LamG domain-containing protein [Polyangium sorediatum]
MKTHLFAALVPLSFTLGCSALVDLDALSSGGGSGSGSGPVELPDGTLEFVDDGFDGEFEFGSFSDTEWAAARLRLKASSLDGAFRSRVFDAGEPVDWTTFTWTPAGPYLKALPDSRGKEVGYAEGSMDMSANVLLLHLDGAGALTPGAAAMDTSGQKGNAVVTAPVGTTLSFEEGPIGQGLADKLNTYLALDTISGDYDFNQGDFTWALWAKTESNCSGNKVFLGVDTGFSGPHLWLGCAPADFGPCGEGSPEGRAAGTFMSNFDDPNDGVPFCGASQINDGQWHHLAAVKKGHAQAQVVLYVDGIAEATLGTTFNTPIFLTGDDFSVGALSKGDFQAEGAYDEVAIWKRALGPDEVMSIYRRGGARLALRVRACNDPACEDGDPPFVGADGSDGWFVDPTGTLGPPTDMQLVVPRARYFQYEVSFEGYREGDGPGLFAVKVHAKR